MSCNCIRTNLREMGLQVSNQAGKRFIFSLRKRPRCTALQFDANAKIVAGRSSFPAGLTGMPGAISDTDMLPEDTISFDKEMGRYPQILELYIVGVA